MTEILNAVGERLVVKPEPPKDRSKSGLHLPQTSQDPGMRGEVISVGEDVQRFVGGETVLYSKLAGMPCELNGQPYLVLHQRDILGQVEQA